MTRSIGKRSLAVLLALILFGSLLPRVALPVSAEDSCSGSCGENLTWYYSCDEEYGSGILYIEGWGDMTNFEFFGPPWYSYSSSIDYVYLPLELTSVGAYAFQDCTALTSVEIPEGVTRVESRAFSGCTALESFTVKNPYCELYCGEAGLPGTMTVYGYDGSTAEAYAAAYGYAFSSLDGPAYGGECGWELWWRFDSDTGTLTVEGSGSMSDFEPEGAPWYALREHITSLSLPAELPRIGNYAFQDCSALTEVVIPASVTTVASWAFSGCTGLQSFTVQNPECSLFSELNELEGTEMWASGLPGVMTVYGYARSTAETYAAEFGYSFSSIGDIFYSGECGIDGNNLTWILNYSTGVLTIEGNGAMQNYSYNPNNPYGDSGNPAPWLAYADAIEELLLPEGITSISNSAFYGCRNLESAVIPDSVTYIGDKAFYECSSLVTSNLPSGITYIGEDAFRGCSSLLAVEIPNSVTSIGNGAFSGCTSLTDLDLPASEAGLGGGVFSGCSSLASVTIPDGWSKINNNMFNGCTHLTSVTIPNSVTEICNAAFDDCESLASVSLPPNLTTIGIAAFQGCSQLSDITIPDSVTYIGQHAFNYCLCLPSVTIPNGVTAIQNTTFCQCYALSSVTIPNSVTRIDHWAFYWCRSLTSVTIPDSVTSIGYSAFNGCTALKSVNIPNGLSLIDERTFKNCSMLTNISIPASVTLVRTDAFSNCTGLKSLIVLNPDCELSCGQSGTPGKMVVYGYSGSTAQTYAEQFGYRFCPLDCFTDVTPDKYYTVPVAWAYANEITMGTGNGSFSPNRTCTREQAVTFLWRAYGLPEPAGTENPFGDVRPGKYYEAAVLWAYYHEPQITRGKSSGEFGVGQRCTRAQIVTFLWAAAGKPEPTGTDCLFTDVRETDYFRKAVLWAVENGITSGTTSTTFSPNASCTRGQAVTFLYRAVGQS